LNVPDKGYSRNVPDKYYSRNVPDKGYSRNVPDKGYSRNVPDKGYSRNTSCALNYILQTLSRVGKGVTMGCVYGPMFGLPEGYKRIRMETEYCSCNQ